VSFIPTTMCRTWVLSETAWRFPPGRQSDLLTGDVCSSGTRNAAPRARFALVRALLALDELASLPSVAIRAGVRSDIEVHAVDFAVRSLLPRRECPWATETRWSANRRGHEERNDDAKAARGFELS